MKVYNVIYERYYDNFSSGGSFQKGNWLYLQKENAVKKVAEIKPIIHEEFKEDIDCGIFVDTPEEYIIKEDSSMCYWGEGVYIVETETED